MGDIVNFDRSGTTDITIKLVPPAKAAYDYLQERLSYSGTDVANRALQIYAYLEQCIEEGKEILVRLPDGNIEKVNWS